MKTTVEFLDAVRSRHRLTSDYKLARFLGVTDTTIGNYRKGRSMMDEAMCLKIAAALELEPGDVLVAIAIEREKRVEVKTAWQRVAKRLAAGVGVALLYITVSTAPNAPAAVAGPIYTYATKRPRRLLRRALAVLLAWCRVLGLTLALSAPAAAANWTGADSAREAVYAGVDALDWAQTRYIAKHPSYYERNWILGDHPSVAEVNRYFALALAAHAAIAAALPPGYRAPFQYVTIGFEAGQVLRNYRIGLRIQF